MKSDNVMVPLYGILGNYYFALNEYEKAIEYYKRAIQILEKQDHELECYDEENLEIMYGNIELANERIQSKK